MSTLDERIKQELEAEAAKLDAMLAREGGMQDMMAASFKGGMRRWVWLIWVVTFLMAIPFFGSVYAFFTAPDMAGHIYWGACMLLAGMMVTTLKLWYFMEMNRASTAREIKRLELAIAEIAATLKAD